MKILQDSPCWDGSILSRGDEVSLLSKYLQDFAPGKQTSPEPFMISGALISSTGLEKVAAIALFRPTLHLATLILGMVGSFYLSSLYIHIPQGHYTLTLYFLLPLLHKASFGHVVPKLFFFLNSALDFEFTPKRPAHTVQLPQALYQAVLTTRLYESSNPD